MTRSDIGDGYYWIRLAEDPKPFIGVDPAPAPVLPVITDGSDNVWFVQRKEEDGNYTLTLKVDGRTLFVQDDGGDLVGTDLPPPFVWTIQKQDDGSYTIEVPSGIIPTRGWTVNNPEPKSPVTINFITIPLPNQKWNFIPWPGPK